MCFGLCDGVYHVFRPIPRWLAFVNWRLICVPTSCVHFCRFWQHSYKLSQSVQKVLYVPWTYTRSIYN